MQLFVREISFLAAENKYVVFAIVERVYNVITFKNALQSVKKEHLDIFSDLESLSNMDQTSVVRDCGKKKKCLRPYIHMIVAVERRNMATQESI